MLAAEDPSLAIGLLLLAYPLHPRQKPKELRDQHFPQIQTPCLFVHGTVDPYGSAPEMRRAMALIPARKRLVLMADVAHDLGGEAFEAAPVSAAVLSWFDL